MEKLSTTTRIILAFAALLLVATYFLPLWEIQLWAPQYPEGLNMKFWLHRISGDYEIINGINHYIGMKTIRAEMFPEFRIMRPLVGFIIVVGLLPAIVGKRRWLMAFAGVLILSAIVGMADFYRWAHDYGNNLNPKAAISIPGMSYEPPIIGYKTLLNFVAYSGPDYGGWIFILVGVTAVSLLVWEKFRTRSPSSQK